jgi:predicted dehydrogenase
MTPRTRIALLSAAHVHAEPYARVLEAASDCSFTLVWDDDEGRGEALAQKLSIPFEASLSRALRKEIVDAVIITAENARHHALCLAACAAGLHVLCEKPLALTAAHAEDMISAAERARVLLATAFPMRHNLPAQRLKEHLRTGAIGPVVAVRATNHGSMPSGWFGDPDLAGGGAVMDHTVHVVDMLRWYLEDEPVEVYCQMSNGLFHGAVEDVAFMIITFARGVVVTLDPSWSRPAASFPTWGDLTLEIAGVEGTAQLDAFAQRLELYPATSGRASWLSWSDSADAAMIRDFIQAIRERRRPAADGRDGERALAVVLAAYQSAASGRPAAVPPVLKHS